MTIDDGTTGASMNRGRTAAMTPDEVRQRINLFCEGGMVNAGMRDAQRFFDQWVHNVEDVERAFLWLTEEVGEAARVIRTGDEDRYIDALGDIQMWLISIARLLDVQLADALEYSVRQLVAKGYTGLPSDGFPIDPKTLA